MPIHGAGDGNLLDYGSTAVGSDGHVAASFLPPVGCCPGRHSCQIVHDCKEIFLEFYPENVYSSIP